MIDVTSAADISGENFSGATGNLSDTYEGTCLGVSIIVPLVGNTAVL